MYPNSYPTPATATGGLGSVLAGGLLYTLLLAGIILVIYWIFFYLVIKTAVRNGVVEAIQKTGLGDGPVTYVQGYPPGQEYGAPPAPASQHGGYRGPIS